MSAHASIWTPRHTHRLWPRPANKPKIKATPYTAPPPPPPLKKPPPPAAATTTSDELEERASDLIAQAEALEAKKPAQVPVRIQLGMLLLNGGEDGIKNVIRKWDQKGKGEFLKGEFRLNLRSTGIQATSVEADELFDSWDECVAHCTCHSFLFFSDAFSAVSRAVIAAAHSTSRSSVARC